MLSEKDLKQIAQKGITVAQIENQLKEFKTGFPFLKLEAAASIGHGIIAPDAAARQQYEEAWKAYKATGKRVVISRRNISTLLRNLPSMTPSMLFARRTRVRVLRVSLPKGTTRPLQRICSKPKG